MIGLIKKFSHIIPDKIYLKIIYKIKLKKKLNLKNPKTFNEKLQWLKIYNRNDIYTKMVDKYEAKRFVSEIIGNEYIIPTIGIFDKWDEIDFEKLPDKFVIKCTHDSGGIVVCTSKKELNICMAKEKIDKSLKQNYFYSGREWPYKNVKPRIIIEKFMEDDSGEPIKDYKFFCFNGEPKIMYMSEGLDNHETASMSFYDMDFKLLSCKRKDYKLLNYIPKKPITFEKMKEYSKLISSNIPHLRVDWYEVNGKLYFGEATFFTNSGFIPFEDEKWDIKLGKMIELKNEEIIK